MYETIEFTAQGIAPLIMHNRQLADPLNEFTKGIKVISGKRKKTDSDHLEMYRLEFMGGLHVNDAGHPIVPGEVVEAAFVRAARQTKTGKQAEAGFISDGDWKLIFDGPKTPAELWADKRFRDVRAVKLGSGSTVMRCRPIFRDWKCKFNVKFLPDMLNLAQVNEIMQVCGRIIGWMDYRPKFGRFEVAA